MKTEESAGLEIDLGLYVFQQPWTISMAIARPSVCLAIDGSRPRFLPMGVHLFTLAPGTHEVRAFCSNLLIKRGSEAVHTVDVKAGTVVHLRYRPHPILLPLAGSWEPRHWRPFVPQDAHGHPAAAPGWFPDPMERHALRYHDEWRWTDHVSDGGTTSVHELPTTVVARRRGRVRLAFQAVAAVLALWAGSSQVACEARHVRQDRETAAFLASPPVLDVAAGAVDSRNEGRLVRVVGPARSYGRATDRDLGVAVEALLLERTVEPVAGPGGSIKPGTRTFLSDWWHVGAFGMPHDAPPPNAGELQAAPAGRWMLQTLAPEHRDRARFGDGKLYLGDPAAPKAGDVRVAYRYLQEATVTVIGRQEGSSLVPYRMQPGGEELWLVRPGDLPASAVRARHVRDRSDEISLGWLFVIPFLLLGAMLSYAPLAAVADALPVLGVVRAAGFLAFAALGTVALYAGATAFCWSALDPRSAAIHAAVATAAAMTLVLIGTRRREREA